MLDLKSKIRNFLCRLGFHDWIRPERADVTTGLKVSRICRNCRKLEEPPDE